MKKLLKFGMVFVLAIGLLGFVPAAKAEFKVGILMVTSGVYAPLGGSSRDGALLAIEDFNAAGGLNGEKIKYYFEDYEGEAAKAISLAKKLTGKKIICFLAGGNTLGTLAIAPITESEKIPQINASPRSPVTAEDIKIKKFSFQTVHENEVDVQKVGDYVKSLGAKKAAILYDSNQYGTSGAMYMYDYFKKIGIEVVLREKYQKGDRDLTPLLIPAREKGAEALVVWGTLPTPATIAKNLKQMGWNIPMVGPLGMGSPRMVKLAGDAADGVVFTSALALKNFSPAEKAFYGAFERKYKGKKRPNYFHAIGYDDALLFIQALKMTKGSHDPLKIRDALENIKGFEGSLGVYNMSPTDHCGLSKDSLHLIKIVKGKWTQLD